MARPWNFDKPIVIENFQFAGKVDPSLKHLNGRDVAIVAPDTIWGRLSGQAAWLVRPVDGGVGFIAFEDEIFSRGKSK